MKVDHPERGDITINTYDDHGVYVVVAEWPHQAPMAMETEGPFSSREAARDSLKNIRSLVRYAICRLVPVDGNELIIKDMERMQR